MHSAYILTPRHFRPILDVQTANAMLPIIITGSRLDYCNSLLAGVD